MMLKLVFLASFIFWLSLPHCVSRSLPRERFQLSQKKTLDFSVRPANPDHFAFAAVGDAHVLGGKTQRLGEILEKAKAHGLEFIIFLGDFVDQGLREDMVAIRDLLKEYGWEKRALFVLGNHDIFGDGFQYSLELNGPSHFSVDVGNARFIGLDTADGTVHEEESSWLENELKKESPQHTFLLSHYLPMIPGQRTYLRLANDVEAGKLMALASGSGVRAWLGGHYHSYIVDKVDGVTYVVAGGGGGRRMPPILDFFFVKVTIQGEQVDYEMIPVSE